VLGIATLTTSASPPGDHANRKKKNSAGVLIFNIIERTLFK
jgi:hypothetical protein